METTQRTETRLSPADVARAVAPVFAGDVISCKVAEDMEGMWDVVARIKPARRGRPFEHSAHGETRQEAVARFLSEATFTAQVHKCEATK